MGLVVFIDGAQLGAYRMLHRIGAGGMGEVWVAEHAMLGRRAAIKVLHRELSARPEIVARFFNEARAATAISDPGIVQVFDFGIDHVGSAYIVMELLEGEPLDRRLERQRALGVAEALRVARQVAASLGAAHARGIVHRDIKPENIFLVADPEVPGGERAKVLDFGIAKLASSPGAMKTSTSLMMGTPMFMSPEQCRGAGNVDARSDVYALGCVLFALIAGRPPFDGEGAGELIAMHLREPAPPLRSGSGALDALLARCLAKDPAQRYANGTELAAAIAPLVDQAGLARVPHATGQSIVQTSPVPTTLSAATGMVTASSGRRGRSTMFAMLVGATVIAVGAAVGMAVERVGGQPGSQPEVMGAAAPTVDAVRMSTVAPADAPVDASVDAIVDAAPVLIDAPPPPVRRAPLPSPPARPSAIVNPWSEPAPTKPAVELDTDGLPKAR